MKAKSKVKKITVRDKLFADVTALVAHSAQDLQTLLKNFLQHAQSLVSPSVLKKLKSYAKEQIFNLQSRSKTSTSKILKVLYTLTLVLLQTHQWTLRLIVARLK